MSRLLGDDDIAVEGAAGLQRFLTAVAIAFIFYIIIESVVLVLIALGRYGWQ